MLPESLNKKSPNLRRTQKTYIKAILKSQKTYIKGRSTVKNVYIKALKIMLNTGFNRFFDHFWKFAQEYPNFKMAISKFWLPKDSKSHLIDSKLPNLAAL